MKKEIDIRNGKLKVKNLKNLKSYHLFTKVCMNKKLMNYKINIHNNCSKFKSKFYLNLLNIYLN